MNFNSPEIKLDDLLARIAESIQLNQSRRERIESAYEAINSVLIADKIFFEKVPFEIYPQGSVKIGTTVKPLYKNEYDLDTVVHIKADWTKISSSELYNHLCRVFMDNEVYKSKVQQKNRCIRIDYAGDFHMDILPGIQKSEDDPNKLMIPDKKLQNWTSSNPKGYAEWFENKSNSVLHTYLEKVYDIEALHIDEYAQKKPLQRAVQLVKMYRDEYFKDNPENATSSIILTTLFGELYENQNSIYKTIEKTLSKIKNIVLSNKPLKVVNPMNKDEIFTEKWEENILLRTSFNDFIRHMNDFWEELQKENFEKSESTLKLMFSEQSYLKAYEEQRSFIRNNSKIKANDFYGLKELAKPKTDTHRPYLK